MLEPARAIGSSEEGPNPADLLGEATEVEF